MSNPDSIVEYVKWLDGRHNRLVNAVVAHRAYKRQRAIPGSVDEFDRELWATLDASYNDEE
jgi:hypothetical protein